MKQRMEAKVACFQILLGGEIKIFQIDIKSILIYMEYVTLK